MPIRTGVLSLVAALLVAVVVRAADAPSAPPTAQQRYDEARQLMQHGRYPEAADAFRVVADSEDAPHVLRAQALFAAGLMFENARTYERAAEIYDEVVRRFPDTPFAARAAQQKTALAAGGPHALDLRRRQDEARDALVPAQAVVERDGLAAARPELERIATVLAGILRDFSDQPKVKDTAIDLGNVDMLLQRYAAARTDFEHAADLGRRDFAADDNPAKGVDTFTLAAEERLAEAVRALRRQRITSVAWSLLMAIGIGLVVVRPWQGLDAPVLRLGAGLVFGTLVLAAVAVGVATWVRHLPDEHSPIEDRAAAALVALPGVIGQAVALGFATGLSATRRWPGRRAATFGAVLGALAALAVATCVVDTFGLFPYLDSEL